MEFCIACDSSKLSVIKAAQILSLSQNGGRVFIFGKISLDFSPDSNHFYLINFFQCLLPRTIFRFSLRIGESWVQLRSIYMLTPGVEGGGGGGVGFPYKKVGVLVISVMLKERFLFPFHGIQPQPHCGS